MPNTYIKAKAWTFSIILMENVQMKLLAMDRGTESR